MEILNSIINGTLKALIVDDEVDICFLLSGILRQKQLKPSFVNNLAGAKESLQKDTPSILFLDNHLPDGRGIDFIPYVRKNYPGIKIVMITAHDTPEDRKRSYENGVDYFLSKPFSRHQINEIIEPLL